LVGKELQPPGLVGGGQPFEEQATEGAREHPHGEEKAGPAGNPGFAIGRDTAAGGEVSLFYTRILVRAWSNLDPFEPARAMGWLSKRVALRGGQGESRTRDLRTAIGAPPNRLRELAARSE
jgi:hypothetical protein